MNYHGSYILYSVALPEACRLARSLDRIRNNVMPSLTTAASPIPTNGQNWLSLEDAVASQQNGFLTR
ncbi:hypothetical protein T10_8138 [Trichinella papuae]|uniref:Uncharacterized protein n=1 Tax=Trichinella papuae TaxID=268474 RepID=A0A0V1M1D7_9BILA|nr:hypothetical protein T10_8138 [Trichinella papuae]